MTSRSIKLILAIILSLFPAIVTSQVRSLDFYVNTGFANSPLLNDLKNQLIASSIDSAIIRAAQKPLIEAKSLLQYSPYGRNIGYDEVITDGGNYQAVAAISQNIFNKKEIENKYLSIGIQRQSVTNSAKLSVADLKKSITSQYLTAYSDFSELSFNKSFLELMLNENGIVKQFGTGGIYKEADYLSLLVETQGQEVIVNQLRSQYEKDIRLLNQLCGINDTALYELQLPELNIPYVTDISNSPLFRQFIIDSLSLINRKSALEIRYRPKVSWFADAGFLTSTPFNFYRHFGASAGISLTVPIYDGQQKNLEIRKVIISENSRSLYEKNYLRQYNEVILQMNGEIRGLNRAKGKLIDQLATSKQLVSALKAQLEAGIIQMTDYINAIKNYRAINRNLNMVSIQMLQIINEMNYLMTQ